MRSVNAHRRSIMVHRPLNRAALLRSTALQAVVGLVLASPASAQPAPNARPTGGQVVAGSASIATTARATTITQSTGRAAIDWRGFDVGRDQSVTFRQPASTSVTLNRVTGGDPSAIAGHITANGQFILTNPSGVTFYQGAQVNAQSVIVSAAGISNRNFMAGRMVFDRAANPNARIDNRGNITVKQAGLAALVAPSVANSGVINARLGQVVLAGASAHTLDMYGDGLVSIDVTKQVLVAPRGADGKPVTALVTNTGVIAADGGVVQLSAAAADGVVQTLVRAGGQIHANTVGNRTGRIEVAGTGGSVVIEGRLAADGNGTGTVGGEIAVAGSAATIVAPTARVTANGRAGGGTVAIGTTLARARTTGAAPAGTSARTMVASGARVSADATGTGDGGRITVLSTEHTSVDGALTARGGKLGGDGGMIEMSGEKGFTLTGSADTSAPHGAVGTILLDPLDLRIAAAGLPGETNLPPANGVDPNIGNNDGGASTLAYVTPTQLQALTGNIHLQAIRDLTVADPFGIGGAAAVTLDAGRNLALNAGVTASTLILNGGTGGISLNGNLTAAVLLSFKTAGAVTQTGGTVTSFGDLTGRVGSLSLTAAGNRITSVGATAPLIATAGGVSIATSGALTIGGTGGIQQGILVAGGQSIALQSTTLSLQSSSGFRALMAPAGTVSLRPTSAASPIFLSATVPGGVLGLTPIELRLINAATLQLGGAGSTGPITIGQGGEVINLAANGGFSNLAVATTGSLTQGGPLAVGSVSGTAGTVLLSNPGNSIEGVSGLVATNALALTTSGDLTISGSNSSTGAVQFTAAGNLTVAAGSNLSSPNLQLTAASTTLTIDGTATSTGIITLTGGTGGIALAATVDAPRVQINTAGPLTQTAGGVTADNLLGTAGSVALTSRTNAIAGIASQNSAFAVTGAAGDFTLVNSVPLTIGSQTPAGGLSVQSGRSITLQTDSLTLNGPTYSGAPKTITATSGTFAITPFTTGTDVVLTSGTKPTNVLALTTTELGETSAATLQVGSLDASGIPTARNVTLGPTAAEPVDLGVNGGYSTLSLLASGAVIAGGNVNVATVTGQAGSLSLPRGGFSGNRIAALAGFTATTGDIDVRTATGLTVSGTVIANGGAGNVTLSANAVITGNTQNQQMLLTADISGATVSLTSLAYGTPSTSGGIFQPSGGITAATLTGAAGFAQLHGSNHVTGLGDFAAYGELTFDNAIPVNVTGAISSATYAVTLNGPGITQTATSSITTPELDITAAGSTVLTGRNNVIGGIGYVNQNVGDLTVATSSPTLLFGSNAGLVNAAAGSLNFIADGVGLVGSPNANTKLQATQGAVTFAPFTPSRRIELIGATAADPNSLSINSQLLSYVSALRLGLGDATTTGPINLLNAGEAVSLTGLVGTLQLRTTGAVTEGVSPGGQNGGGTLGLTVQNLTGGVGSIALAAPANAIREIGFADGIAGEVDGLVATGSATVLGTPSIAVANTVSANLATGTLTIQSVAGVTTLGVLSGQNVVLTATGGGVIQTAGSITAPGTLTLSASGAVSQSGGAISAGTLAGNAGSLSLPTATNTVATIGGFTSGPFALTDAQTLTIAGYNPLGNTALTVTGNLVNGGTLSTGTLALNVSGAFTDPGGRESGTTLSGTVGSLNLSSSDFDTLGGLAGTSGITMVNGNPLAIVGPVTDATSIDVTAVAGMTIAGNVSAPLIRLRTQDATTATDYSNNVDVPAPITQTAGTISGLDILIASSDALTLSGGAVTSTGPVALSSNGGLSIGAAVTGTQVTLTAATKTATGPLGTPVVTPGVITEPAGGSVTATTVTGASGSTTTLGAATNAIGSLGPFTSVGGFALVNGGPLTVSGPLSDSVSIALTTGALTLAGTVTAPNFDITASGAVTQPSGTVNVSALGGSAAGASFGQTTNQVVTLAGFTSSVDFTLTDSVAVSIAGAVSVGTGRTLTIIDNAPSFATGGSLAAPSGTVALREFTAGAGITLGSGGTLSSNPPVTATTLSVGAPAGGPITIAGAFNLTTVAVLDVESGGAITETGAGAIGVGSLTGHGASATLGGANMIANLGLFTTTGAFALADTGNLAITGALTASTVALTASGAITEPGGSIVTASLTGSAASATLNSAANQIVTLAGFTTTGDFSIVDGRSLTVSALVDPTTVTMNVAGDLVINSTVSAGSVILIATGNITEGASGRVFASALTGSAASATLNTANGVGTLGGFTTSTGFALANSFGLTVAGPVVDGASISLGTTGVLTLAGTIQAPSVNLVSTSGVSLAGGINQTGGAITASTLTGSSSGTASLGSATNAVATLGGFTSAGGFTLADGQALSVTGPVTDPTSVALSAAGGLSLAGTVTTGALSLVASGGITQPGGSLVAASLTGSAGAAGAALTQSGNRIATLGAFASGGDFALTDAVPVSIAGAVSAGGGRTLTLTDDAPSFAAGGSLSAPSGTVGLREFTPGMGITLGSGGTLASNPPVTATTLSVGAPTGGPITITGAFNLATVAVLDLESGGAITETATGAVGVGTLTGNGGSAALGGANAIAAVGGFTTTGAFALADTGNLAITGALSASTVSLTPTGALSESGAGQITATTLSGSAASVALGNANAVAALGNFASTGAFVLADAGNLALSGTLSGTTVSLTPAGALTEAAAGRIVAGTFTGSATSAALGGANSVGTLGGFTTSTGFALANSFGLTVAGPVVDGASISLSTTGVLTLAGTIQAPSVNLVSTSGVSLAGGINQTGGAITATTLTGSSSATASLDSATNAVGTLGGFSSAGGFALVDGQSLSVTGPVSDATSVALSATGGLSLAGNVITGALSLVASGGVTQPGGSLVASNLTGSAGAAGAALTQAGNHIGTLLTFTSGGDFALTDPSVMIGGPVSAGTGRTLTLVADTLTFLGGGSLSAPSGTVALREFTPGAGITLGSGGTLASNPPVTATTLSVGAPSGGPITITGAFDLATVAVLDLESGGAITETATGALGVGTLTGNGASAALGGANAIAAVGGFTTTGAFALADTGALAITGPLSASTVSLTPSGALTESGAGTITTATLSGSAASAALGNANAIASLGPFTTTGAFALADTGALAITGALSASTVSLTPSGALTESGAGTITTATLTGSAASTALGNANSIASLGPFTTPGAFALADIGNLAITGALTASTVALTTTGALTESGAGTITTTALSGSAASAALGTANVVASLGQFTTPGSFALADIGNLAITGPLTASTVALTPTGAITESGAGTITTTTLSGSASSAALGNANAIASLGPFTTTGAFALADTGNLAITGAVSASMVSLTPTGALIESGAGTITTATLSGSATSAALGNANAIASLGPFATNGAFALADTGNLAITGPLSASTVSLTPTGALSESGAGTITTATLSGSVASAALGSANAIAALGNFASTGAFVLADAGNLALSGTLSGTTVSLTPAGALTEAAAGRIVAGTFTGSATSAALGGANSVGTLGGFTTSTGFALANSFGLTVAGPVVDGASISLSTTGVLTLAGTIQAPSVNLVSTSGVSLAGGINQTGGAITATTLTGSSSGSASLGSATNAVGTLGGFTSAGGFTLADGQALSVTGPVSDPTSVALSAAGGLSLAGNVTTGALSLVASGAITQPSGSLVAASLTGGAGAGGAALTQSGNRITTLGAFASGGDFALTDAVAVGVAGAVSVGGGRTLTLTDDAPSFAAGGSLSAPSGTVGLREFTPGMGITLGSGGTLASNPPVTATTLSVGAPTGGPITITGAFNLATVAVLDLESGGAITETATGAVGVGTLTGNGGSAALGGANAIAAVGGFATTGAFALADTGNLAITGALSASTVSLTPAGALSESGAGQITATTLSGSAASVALGSANAVAALGNFASTGAFVLADAGNLALSGTLSGTTVSLTPAGALTEAAAGRIVAGTFTGSATSAALGGANSVGTLGGFTTSTGFALANSFGLTVAGPVVDGASISLSTTGVLTLAGTIQAPSVNLVSTSGVSLAGGINQTGGAITASTLTGSSSGSASLGSATNAVATLGGFTSAGGFTLADGQALSVTGPVSDPTSVALSAAGGLSLAGNVTTGALSLVASGAITQPSGSLVAASLTGGAGAGGAALTQSGNRITTLGAFASGGDFALTDAVAVGVAGAVSVGGGRTLTLTDDAPSFAAGGSLSAPSGTVGLREFTPGMGITLGSGGTLASNPPVTATTLSVGAPTGGPITITGAFNLATVAVLDLESGGAITETATGAVGVGTLTGNGGSAALGGANAIAAVGGFATTGAFALADTGNLAITGALSASTVSLTPAGALSESGAGQITATTLSGSAASVALGSANAVAALGNFASTGAFVLADAGNLALSGTLSGTTVSLTPAGALTEAAAGRIVAGTFTGSATSAALGGANSVGTLGGFTTSTGFALANSFGLTVAGPVVDGASISLSTTGVLTLAGTIQAPSVNLVSTSGVSLAGGINQTGGAITATTLTGSSSGSASLGSATNAVGTLGGFTSAGGFTLVDGQSLSVTGPVSDPTSVALSATGGLSLAGNVTTGALSLVASGAITQPSGNLVAASLTGGAGAGGAALTQSGNRITTLGAFASGGDFALTDAVAVGVAGAVSVGGGRTLTLTDDAPSFAAGGSLSAPSGTVGLREFTPGMGITLGSGGTLASNPPVTATTLSVGAPTGGPITITGAFNLATVAVLDLESGGAITETATGAVGVGTLTGNGGSAALGGANAIAAVGGFATTGAFALADTGNLAITGALTASTVSLTPTGALSESGAGQITATTLSGSAASAALGNANTIANLGPFTTTGAFALADTGNLAITGPLSASTVALTPTGALTESGAGLITATTLSGSAASAALGNANVIANLGLFTTPGAFALADAGDLALAGALTASTVALTTTGAISEVGGAIITASLSGGAASAALTSPGNQIAALGGFATTGAFVLADTGNLALTGALAASTVTLTTTGALTQPSGGMVASSLTGGAGPGGVALTQRANRIGTLLNLTSGGDLALTDAIPVSIVGGVSAAPGRTLTLTDDAPSFAAGGTLSAPSGTVALAEFTQGAGITLAGGSGLGGPGAVTATTLRVGSPTGGPIAITGAFNLSGVSVLDVESGGAVTETGAGALGVASLTGHAATASLGGANQIGTLALFAATGDLTLNDARGLAVTGPVTASTVSLNVAGDLALAGTLSAPGGVSLIATGAITQPGGAITTGSLFGRASSAALNAPANQIATLAGFQTTGDFSIVDGRSLVVSGLVDPNTVSFAIAGDLTLNSSVVGGTVVLAATGAITEGIGGQVVTTALTGAATSVALGGANQVATLSGFGTVAGFALNTGSDLAVTGAVTTGQSIALTTPGALNLSGSLQAPSVTLVGSNITQTGGALTADTAAINAAYGVTLGGTANVGTFTVITPGAMSQTGGSLTVATLSGRAGGQINLGVNGSATVANAVDLSSGTAITLTDTSALRIAGTLSAPNLVISATGSLQLDGGTIATNGAPLALQLSAVPASSGSTLQVLAGADGTARLRQTGTTVIQSLSSGASALRLGLASPNGTMSLNELVSPATDIVLALGTGGRATGDVNVGDLSVIGSGGSARLTGRVAARTGTVAAQVSHISPRVNDLYELNGCTIQASTCGPAGTLLTNLQITSVLRPDILTLDILDLSVTRDRDDPTLLLPNISDRDY